MSEHESFSIYKIYILFLVDNSILKKIITDNFPNDDENYQNNLLFMLDGLVMSSNKQVSTHPPLIDQE